MEKYNNQPTIPQNEQIDGEESLVTPEEMAIENQAMMDAVQEEETPITERIEADQVRINELREELKSQENSQEAPPEISQDELEEEGGEPIMMHETDVQYEKCPNCSGKGRVLFSLLQCPKCGGSGKTPALKQKWRSKVVGYK